ncbi:MAG: hypothetical protein AAB955_00260 [Patescibacteria group bacterium]
MAPKAESAWQEGFLGAGLSLLVVSFMLETFVPIDWYESPQNMSMGIITGSGFILTGFGAVFMLASGLAEKIQSMGTPRTRVAHAA